MNSDYNGKFPSTSGLRCESKSKGGGFSPPLMALEIVWAHSLKKTGHSWTRLNWALCQYIDVCINVGMPFDLGDFAWIVSHYSSSYWADTERWYSIAVKVNNLTACKSLESYKKSEPFIFNGHRLAVGTDVCGIYQTSNMGQEWKPFEWAYLPGVKVTSFSRDQRTANLTISDNSKHPAKVVRRFTIKHDDLKAANALIRADKKRLADAKKLKESKNQGNQS